MYTFDDAVVSDLHKEAYGFRPQGDFFARWKASSDDQKQAIWDDLHSDAERRWAEDQAEEDRAVADFEGRVLAMQLLGAADRTDAIRWIMSAEGHADERDGGYVCFCLGLPYSYTEEFNRARAS